MSYHVPGPCLVKWKGTSIGTFREGFRIIPRTEWIPMHDTDHGSGPAAFIYGGKGAIVELPGLDTTLLKPLWRGKFGNITNEIGVLASSIAGALTIFERGSVNADWSASKAIAVEPSVLNLVSTQELVEPVVFLILPDSDNILFQTIPTYITGE